ncbi:MAG: hypothetical protein WAO02_08070 [Verrucomicrobiia bacterium]
MKTNRFQKTLAAVVAGGLALLAMGAWAQNASDSTAQILKLEQAKISDDTIIAYIKNSGNSYNLDATQIISLRQQGVSDAVLTAMLSQPRGAVAAATVPMPSTPAPQVASTAVAPGPATYSTATVAPTVTYVQTVPTTYYYQPYYYPSYGYYGWPYPAVSLSFGWGGYWGGGWHGGSGWHGGGGWNGGGGHGGGGWNGGGGGHGGGHH